MVVRWEEKGAKMKVKTFAKLCEDVAPKYIECVQYSDSDRMPDVYGTALDMGDYEVIGFHAIANADGIVTHYLLSVR